MLLHRCSPIVALLILPFLFALGPRALGAPPAPGDGEGQPPIAPVPQPTAEPAAPVPGADAVACRDRRSAVQELLGKETVLVVLARGKASGFTGRVRSDDCFYLSPFPADDGALVCFAGEDGQVRHHVYLPPRRAAFERWNGPTIGPGEETAALYAFDAALPIADLDADLTALLATRSRLAVSATAPADGRERADGLVERLAAVDPARPVVRPTQGSSVPEGAVQVISAGGAISRLRGAKSAEEIRRVRAAVEATVVGLGDAARSIAPDVPEYQIQAVIEFHCRLRGCLTQAFDSIVGSGPNSCVLHYKDNVRTMRAGELVVVDVGGEYEGYAADVTRTFPVSGTFSERQAEVYDAVLAAQLAGLAAVRPGVTLRQVHEAARAVLEERGFARWFLHGTSHSVGLNVHDTWSSKRVLEPGSILTVEPGVYIAEEALGVRIEDTVVVTEDGCDVLSAGVPKEREAIEALMREPAPFALPETR